LLLTFPTVRATVEERPFQGRVTKPLLPRPLGPVVGFRRPLNFPRAEAMVSGITPHTGAKALFHSPLAASLKAGSATKIVFDIQDRFQIRYPAHHHERRRHRGGAAIHGRVDITQLRGL